MPPKECYDSRCPYDDFRNICVITHNIRLIVKNSLGMIYFKFVLQVINCFFYKKCKHIFDSPYGLALQQLPDAPSLVDVCHPAPWWLRWHRCGRRSKWDRPGERRVPALPLRKYRKAEAKCSLLTDSSKFYHTLGTYSIS